MLTKMFTDEMMLKTDKEFKETVVAILARLNGESNFYRDRIKTLEDLTAKQEIEVGVLIRLLGERKL